MALSCAYNRSESRQRSRHRPGLAIVDAITANIYRDHIAVRSLEPSFEFDFEVLTNIDFSAYTQICFDRTQPDNRTSRR